MPHEGEARRGIGQGPPRDPDAGPGISGDRPEPRPGPGAPPAGLLLLLLALLLAVARAEGRPRAPGPALELGPGRPEPGGLVAPVAPVGGGPVDRLDLDGHGDGLVGLALPDPPVRGDVGEV